MLKLRRPYSRKVHLHIRQDLLKKLWDKYVPEASAEYGRIELIYLDTRGGQAGREPRQIQLLVNLVLRNRILDARLSGSGAALAAGTRKLENTVRRAEKCFLTQLRCYDVRLFRMVNRYVTLLEQYKEEGRRYQNWQRENRMIERQRTQYHLFSAFSSDIKNFLEEHSVEIARELEKELIRVLPESEYGILAKQIPNLAEPKEFMLQYVDVMETEEIRQLWEQLDERSREIQERSERIIRQQQTEIEEMDRQDTDGMFREKMAELRSRYAQEVAAGFHERVSSILNTEPYHMISESYGEIADKVLRSEPYQEIADMVNVPGEPQDLVHEIRHIMDSIQRELVAQKEQLWQREAKAFETYGELYREVLKVQDVTKRQESLRKDVRKLVEETFRDRHQEEMSEVELRDICEWGRVFAELLANPDPAKQDFKAGSLKTGESRASRDDAKDAGPGVETVEARNYDSVKTVRDTKRYDIETFIQAMRENVRNGRLRNQELGELLGQMHSLSEDRRAEFVKDLSDMIQIWIRVSSSEQQKKKEIEKTEIEKKTVWQTVEAAFLSQCQREMDEGEFRALCQWSRALTEITTKVCPEGADLAQADDSQSIWDEETGDEARFQEEMVYLVEEIHRNYDSVKTARDTERYKIGRYDPEQKEIGRYDPEQKEIGRYDPERYKIGRYDPEQKEIGRYDPEQYKIGRYDPEQKEIGRYDPEQYKIGRYDPEQKEIGRYDPEQNEIERHDKKQNDIGSYGAMQHDMDEYDAMQHDMDEYDAMQHDMDEYDAMQHDMDEYGTVQNDIGFYGTVQYDIVRHDMEYYEDWVYLVREVSRCMEENAQGHSEVQALQTDGLPMRYDRKTFMQAMRENVRNGRLRNQDLRDFLEQMHGLSEDRRTEFVKDLSDMIQIWIRVISSEQQKKKEIEKTEIEKKTVWQTVGAAFLSQCQREMDEGEFRALRQWSRALTEIATNACPEETDLAQADDSQSIWDEETGDEARFQEEMVYLVEEIHRNMEEKEQEQIIENGLKEGELRNLLEQFHVLDKEERTQFVKNLSDSIHIWNQLSPFGQQQTPLNRREDTEERTPLNRREDTKERTSLSRTGDTEERTPLNRREDTKERMPLNRREDTKERMPLSGTVDTEERMPFGETRLADVSFQKLWEWGEALQAIAGHDSGDLALPEEDPLSDKNNLRKLIEQVDHFLQTGEFSPAEFPEKESREQPEEGEGNSFRLVYTDSQFRSKPIQSLLRYARELDEEQYEDLLRELLQITHIQWKLSQGQGMEEEAEQELRRLLRSGRRHEQPGLEGTDTLDMPYLKMWEWGEALLFCTEHGQNGNADSWETLAETSRPEQDPQSSSDSSGNAAETLPEDKNRKQTQWIRRQIEEAKDRNNLQQLIGQINHRLEIAHKTEQGEMKTDETLKLIYADSQLAVLPIQSLLHYIRNLDEDGYGALVKELAQVTKVQSMFASGIGLEEETAREVRQMFIQRKQGRIPPDKVWEWGKALLYYTESDRLPEAQKGRQAAPSADEGQGQRRTHLIYADDRNNLQQMIWQMNHMTEVQQLAGKEIKKEIEIEKEENRQAERSVRLVYAPEELRSPSVRELLQYIHNLDKEQYEILIEELTEVTKIQQRAGIDREETGMGTRTVLNLQGIPEAKDLSNMRNIPEMEVLSDVQGLTGLWDRTDSGQADHGTVSRHQSYIESYRELAHHIRQYEVQRRQTVKKNIQDLSGRMRKDIINIPGIQAHSFAPAGQSFSQVRQGHPSQELAYSIQAADASREEQQRSELRLQEENRQIRSAQEQLGKKLTEVEEQLKAVEGAAKAKDDVRTFADQIKRQLYEELHVEKLRRGLI